MARHKIDAEIKQMLSFQFLQKNQKHDNEKIYLTVLKCDLKKLEACESNYNANEQHL